ncbi:MAG: endolytic transglycosylase MltG [Candidatus Levyibacteriota bacterium]
MKRIFILIIFLLVLIGAGFIWWTMGLKAVNPQDKNQVIFVVEKGKGIKEIANKLKGQGLIKDSIIFFLYVKKQGIEGKIQAGDFRLSPSMNAEDIAEELTHGTLDVWVTIPEGVRATEIADILAKKIPTYKESWKAVLEKNEGYLFPDTYLLPKDTDINLAVTMMKNNFEIKFAQISDANRSKLTKSQIVILASMIEREAKFANDRPLVASVLLNRLQISMPLQIDATIQYALGFWKRNLTTQDLKIKSPYNTYLNVGLPPAPISNPGLDALKAVINPADTNYLYYVSDKSSHNHYAKTLEEHNANIKKYAVY